MNSARIAALRPLMPVDVLASIMGKHWSPPDAHGYVPDTHNHGFGAQVEVGGKLGKVGFYKSFSDTQLIEGLHIGMPLEAALHARPNLQMFENGPKDPLEWTQYRDRTDDGHDLIVRFRGGAILALEISQPDAVYPEPDKLLADTRLNTVYDLLRDPQRPLPATGRGEEWAGGWNLGLPPGITPVQWPLSPSNGHPLRHAFTLHVPSQYRAQGAQFVAFSLFVDDQFEELPSSSVVEAFFAAPLSSEPPADVHLLPFWQHRQARHPRQFDMEDILGTRYAAIWLTQAEFEAALCPSPDLRGNPLLGQAPGWLDKSYREYYGYEQVRNPGEPAYEWLQGEGRAAGLDTAFPVRAQEREGDPNVGKPPREWEDECQDSGYVPGFSDEGVALELERFHGRNHFGGTMFPVQGYPEFGPRYLEFEEDFGGFNFGSGNGQIDLEKMEMDWACG
ncbi:hypothetical protein ASF84_06110 [Pseudomonas sp. Leaf127]|uniref:DUF7256 domain-containing protein n=1 Tax=Pseudomonas sp. Leaf127 TaxID=1736267 RepID=UPI0007038C99|nr:hypothetical protein [Pseudomonas sp. Leaf127]KQQ60269.1 hypothetical protein ASF84_06110 [Pseudomonas sp. Leaf127]